MEMNPSVVWFRKDLRLEDQPAFAQAIQRGGPVLPLFIWSPEEEGKWAPGGASRWWLHHSLVSLQNQLEKFGLTLILRQSSSLETIKEICKTTGADAVFWNRCFEPEIVARDALIKSELQNLGITTQIFNGNLLFDPWNIHNLQGKPYQIFTYFWKACCQKGEPSEAMKLSGQGSAYNNANFPFSLKLEDFHLLPHIHWDQGLIDHWQPGSKKAHVLLNEALEEKIHGYIQKRDFPAEIGTTEFSPYLHFGELSPRVIWHAVRKKFGTHPEAESFLRQLGWREFAYYLLYHFPHTPEQPLHARFQGFPWKKNPEALRAWEKGQTGFPIVDAGMRQLWKTGWMHNRVRMIVGSFLVKDLLIHWLDGAKWFWDTLVDADLANNTLGWQWVGGCGADAAPYFRIFNPITQGKKFDSDGNYVRHWIPEIRALPNKWIHHPWTAPESVLKEAGIYLGVNYPSPIVEHEGARKAALEAYHNMEKSL